MIDVEHWLHSWQALGVEDSPALRKLHGEVLTRYSEPHRRYHARQHLVECFERASEILHLAVRPAEVEIALWFHDAVYEPRETDNEQRSGMWVRDVAQSRGVSVEVAQRLYDLVMFTCHTIEPIGTDAQVLVDADLSILGASAERFEEYEVARVVRTDFPLR